MTSPDPAAQRSPAVFEHYYEGPAAEPAGDEIWCYCDRPCYSPGETIQFHISTTAPVWHLEILRDASQPTLLFERGGLPGARHDTPADVSVVGCGWPVAFEFEIPRAWPTGGYRVTCRIDGAMGPKENHQLFLLRSNRASREKRVLLVASTGTWCAYNDWGGSNHYSGITGPSGNDYAPVLSLERPLPRGFVVLPPEAPRAALVAPPDFGSPVSYPHMEWAWRNGYSKKYASAGWASYERHFVHWAERAGFEVDLVSQFDLQSNPTAIEGYRCLCFIGHDEYWSWEMRDTVDAWVEAGGRVARLAGNFLWQTRLEDGGRRQVCYKYRARDEDPLRGSERVTTAWEAPEVGRPGAATFGLNALRGVYAGWGGCVAFGAGGFPIYRPDHWAFAGTGLGYGDVLGAAGRVFAYEVDGLDYVIRDGLPYPSGVEAVPDGLEILAVGLASNTEVARGGIATDALFLGDEDCAFRASVLHGDINPATMALASRGSGMIVHFPKGRGEVFHAGSVEWVAGLLRRDPQVERVTRNLLERYLAD